MRLALLLLVAVAGCAPTHDVRATIAGALAFAPPDCAPAGPLTKAALDVGEDREYVAALEVKGESDGESAVAAVTDVAVYFAGEGLDDTLPLTEQTSTRVGVGAFTELPEPPDGVVLASVVTKPLAGALREALEPGVDPVAIEARVSVNAVIDGVETTSPFFAIPLEVCAGCLVPTCANGQEPAPPDDGACLEGQDVAYGCRE